MAWHKLVDGWRDDDVQFVCTHHTVQVRTGNGQNDSRLKIFNTEWSNE